MPVSVLVYGGAGSGKTYSLRTLIKAGQNVRLLSAESNCLPVVKKFLREYEADVKAGKVPPLKEGQFAVCVPELPKRTFADFAKIQADSVIKGSEIATKSGAGSRAKFNKFANICQAATQFIGTDGVNYGSIDDWGDDTTFVVDSLTAVSEAITGQIAGDKLALTRQDWGAMQGLLMPFILLLTEGVRCNFVLTAHPYKEMSESIGSAAAYVTKIYPSNLGQALNDKIPAKFSEVVWSHTAEEGGQLKYYWSTKERLAVTRYTNLPCSNKIQQDFSLIFDS